MMRIGLLVAMLLWSGLARASCPNSVPAIPPLSRLGLHTWNTDYCDAGTDLNADHTYLDAHACTDDHPCVLTESKDFPIENIAAGDDDFELFTARAALTLLKVTCHCDLNCGTPATLTFEDRSLNAIGITGGGSLTCGTGTSNSTFTTFDTADSDRLLSLGEGFKFSTTNSPTASQRVTLTVVYTIP